LARHEVEFAEVERSLPAGTKAATFARSMQNVGAVNDHLHGCFRASRSSAAQG
jgi:hypothetical protein